MANPFTGTAATFSPIDYIAPDVSALQRQLTRQQAIADLLKQRSLEDDSQTQMVSGWAIPNSPFKPIEKLANALLARKMQGDVDTKQSEISKRYAEALTGQGGIGGSGATGVASGPSFQTAMMLSAMGLPVPPKLVEQLSGVQPNKEIVKVDTGDGVKVIAVDPITGAQTLVSEVSKGTSPDAQLSAGVSVRGQDLSATTARRGQDIGSVDQQRGQNLTASTAMRGQDLDYNAKNAAQTAEQARNTPQAKAAVAAAEAGAKGAVEQQQKREGAAAGVNNVITQAQGLLKGVDLTHPIVNGKAVEVPLPTNSGIGAGLDWLGSLGGISTGGAETADQLKVLGSRLVLSMPRMEGPQSDSDRRLYTDMAGQVGDPTIPIARRLKALESVRQIVGKYDTSAPPNSAGGTSWDYVPGKGMVPRQ